MAVANEIPKSRLTLRYRTDVDGEKADMELPFRLMVMGDFSQGTSKDQKTPLEQRQIRNFDGKNLNSVMADMGMSVEVSVPNRIDGNGEVDVRLPITSMRSFEPEAIIEAVPKMKALLRLRKVLNEVQGNMDNRREFRDLVRQLGSNPEAAEALKKELEALGYNSFRVPNPAEAKAAEGGDAGGEKAPEGGGG